MYFLLLEGGTFSAQVIERIEVNELVAIPIDLLCFLCFFCFCFLCFLCFCFLVISSSAELLVSTFTLTSQHAPSQCPCNDSLPLVIELVFILYLCKLRWHIALYMIVTIQLGCKVHCDYFFGDEFPLQ